MPRDHCSYGSGFEYQRSVAQIGDPQNTDTELLFQIGIVWHLPPDLPDLTETVMESIHSVFTPPPTLITEHGMYINRHRRSLSHPSYYQSEDYLRTLQWEEMGIEWVTHSILRDAPTTLPLGGYSAGDSESVGTAILQHLHRNGRVGWQPQSLLNIWVLPMSKMGVSGSVSFPHSCHGPYSGIYYSQSEYLHYSCGRGGSLAHYLGHWLGLAHVEWSEHPTNIMTAGPLSAGLTLTVDQVWQMRSALTTLRLGYHLPLSRLPPPPEETVGSTTVVEPPLTVSTTLCSRANPLRRVRDSSGRVSFREVE